MTLTFYLLTHKVGHFVSLPEDQLCQFAAKSVYSFVKYRFTRFITDGRMDGQTDGRTDMHTDERTDRRTNGRTDGQVENIMLSASLD